MLWVDTCELQAKRVAGYGALGAREREFLDDQAASLERSVRALELVIASSSPDTNDARQADANER
jgi:hypothetical protein